jgi:hypothetical protein
VKPTKDHSQKLYEIQLKYGKEWRMVERPSPFLANQVWHSFIKRYKTYQVRMMCDGKVIRKRS